MSISFLLFWKLYCHTNHVEKSCSILFDKCVQLVGLKHLSAISVQLNSNTLSFKKPSPAAGMAPSFCAPRRLLCIARLLWPRPCLLWHHFMAGLPSPWCIIPHSPCPTFHGVGTSALLTWATSISWGPAKDEKHKRACSTQAQGFSALPLLMYGAWAILSWGLSCAW